jgi:7-cyano-7-deazaguanine synthase in queuosine biosynthesis
MTTSEKPHVFACNGATVPCEDATVLTYDKADPQRLVNLMLPNFVDQFYHLPPRILDLLEIAAYVFAGDRATGRGPKDALEYHAWPRRMHFHVKVRDEAFWSQGGVKASLCAALKFMTGDLEYAFEFSGGHSTPPASLFDSEEFAIASDGPASVVLFSGGLDSLAGTLERLVQTKESLYLISHRSGQPSTKKTQDALVRALNKTHPGRIHHYSFGCGLSHVRGVEETQRTRAFLFCSIAFAVAHRVGLDSFYAYENGVTSLNFIRRQDLMSARASRTTHPKTHHLMAQFLGLIHGGPVKVLNPLWNRTKGDVFELLGKMNGRNLIGSAVSCSKTFRELGHATHCGCCFQCIDRRLAAYAAGLQGVDNAGIYSADVFASKIESAETKTTVIDYVRQAIDCSTTNEDAFVMTRLSELADVTPYLGLPEDDAVDAVWELCHRHGNQVVAALARVRDERDDVRYPLASGSLLQLVAAREHLKPAGGVDNAGTATLGATVPDATKTQAGGVSVEVVIRAVAPETKTVADGDVQGRRAGLCAPHCVIGERVFHLNGVAHLLPESVTCGERLVGIKELRKVATDVKAKMLITGETGTGKESIAEFVFAESKVPVRKRQTVNCASLDAARADSDLFGHIKGAFTGADSDRDGILKKCEGGAVFLDEIGALPKETQQKILRFVEYNTRRRVGDDTTDIVRTRVLAATNANVSDALIHDLVPRFQCQVALPPLRERLRDILWFVSQPAFLTGGQYSGISLRTLCCLFSNDWKDNIRGLQNCCQEWKRMGTGGKDGEGYIADVETFRGLSSGEWAGFAAYALAVVEKSGVVGTSEKSASVVALVGLLLAIKDGGSGAADGRDSLALDCLPGLLEHNAPRYAIGALRGALAATNKAFCAGNAGGDGATEECDLGDAIAELVRLHRVYLGLGRSEHKGGIRKDCSSVDNGRCASRPSKSFEEQLRGMTIGVTLWKAPEPPGTSPAKKLEALMDQHKIEGEDRLICRLCADGKSIAAIARNPGIAMKQSTIQEHLHRFRGLDEGLSRLLPRREPGRRNKNRPD